MGDNNMGIDFYKYHALGNDYIVIDPNKTQINLSPKHIQLICHRNFGIGSDGILLGPIFEGNWIQLRIFNPDGSEAEKSGNGRHVSESAHTLCEWKDGMVEGWKGYLPFFHSSIPPG
jgi:diaminopimelate epimerase